MRSSTLGLITLCLLGGCTALKSSVHLVQAEQALLDAQERDAENQAVYEYTMAVRYLEKAREENGSADYKVSEALAKRSIEWSDKAVISLQGGRRGLDAIEDDFVDLPAGPPRPMEDLPLDEAGDDLLEPLEDEVESPPEQPLEEPLEEPVDEPVDPGDEFDLDDDWDLE